jgi:hypothetical protein
LDRKHARAAASGTVAAACFTVFLAGCGSGTHRSFNGDPVGNSPPVSTSPNPPPFPNPPPPNPPTTPPTTPPTNPPTTPPVTQVTLSGVITFDRVPFNGTLGDGLDFTATVQSPVRGARIEVIAAATGTPIQTATTSETGAYSFTVPASTQIFLRVKAELERSGGPTWKVSVRDNTSSDALYALDSATFDSGTVATLTRDLNAASGWSSGSYTGTRSAAPFALLDVVYQSMQLVLTADAAADFPELNLFWSPDNVPVDGDTDLGEIGTSFFEPAAGVTPAAIYVLGAADVDTDEFDRHVIAHEWGHYYQEVFSRDDSIGGDHSPFDQLDIRVAFSEGWSDALSAMINADPEYRDSFDVGEAADEGANLETTVLPNSLRGWFGEGSIALLLYDLFDGSGGDNDAVETGFGPIHASMISLKDSRAMTSIHGFLTRLRTNVPAAQVGAIAALATGQRINASVTSDFATQELNSGGVQDPFRVVPIYTWIETGQMRQTCSTGDTGYTYNKLGNSRFMWLNLTSPYTGTMTVFSTSVHPDRDADVIIFRNGEQIDSGEGPGNESLPLNLEPGTYVFEVYDASNIYGDLFGYTPIGDNCINVTLTP